MELMEILGLQYLKPKIFVIFHSALMKLMEILGLEYLKPKIFGSSIKTVSNLCKS